MKGHPFQVGDKVVTAHALGRLTIVPQLVPGRVYCVSAVGMAESEWMDTCARVCLVGIRKDRRYNRPPGADDSLPAAYFRLVGQRGGNAKRMS